jgi:hypothetical protein
MKYTTILLFILTACASSKPSAPRNAREAHIFKYTDLAVEAKLKGLDDSVTYYLNLAMSYDSINKIEWYGPPIKMNVDTVPVRRSAPSQVKLFDAIWDSGWTSYMVRSRYEDGQPQTLMEYLLHHDTLTIQPTPADSLLKRAKVILAGGKTFIEKP